MGKNWVLVKNFTKIGMAAALVLIWEPVGELGVKRTLKMIKSKGSSKIRSKLSRFLRFFYVN